VPTKTAALLVTREYLKRRKLSTGFTATPYPAFTLSNLTDLTTRLEVEHNNIIGGKEEERLWVLAYLDNQVIWGTFSSKTGLDMAAKLEPAYLQELRMFGQRGEFYLWRDGAGFAARLRLDNEAPPEILKPEQEGYSPYIGAASPDAADEWQVLWGTQVKSNSTKGWTRIFEDRGADFEVPHRIEESQQDTRLPLRMLVRHYLGEIKVGDEGTGLCFYNDMRLVQLRDARLVTLAPSKGEV